MMPPTSQTHHSKQTMHALGMASFMWDPHSCRHSVDQPDGVHNKG